MREIEIQSDNCIVVLGIGVCLVALGLTLQSLSALQQTILQATGYTLAGASILYLVGCAAWEGAKELWAANVQAARYPEVMRQVLRIVNTWRLISMRWDEPDNAGRAHFDPAVESLLEKGKLEVARRLATEKLVVAHASGESSREKVYRRYVRILDRMQEAA
jgi:hypothetical protein